MRSENVYFSIEMRITIITDGNNQLGMGHVYQSLTLASTLSVKAPAGTDISFITKSSDCVTDLIKAAGFSVCRKENDEAIFNALQDQNPDRIIFDKLDVAPDLALKIKKQLGQKLIIFTNLTEANKYADITVMAAMGSNFKNIYRVDKLSGKVELWGPKYLLLRHEFYEYGAIHKSAPAETNKVMLIFGGSDQANLSTYVLEELFKMNQAFAITLVLGSAFAFHNEIQDMMSKYQFSRSTLTIVQNLKNVGKTMFENDLVFVSPGLSFFESLSVGTPVLCFHQNEFQQNAWRDDLKTYGREDVYQIKTLIENRSFIFPDEKFVLSMEIGMGKDEMIAEILS